MHLKEGTLLQNGKYRIERKLGQGSYGITYLATMKSRVGGSLGNMEVSVSVAVKEFFVHDNDGREGSMVTYSKGSSLHEKYKKKFRTESEKLSRLSHPNIVKVLDSFESNNTYYYVMEYCGGGSLDSVIPKNKGLEEMDAIRYAIEIGEALRYMHGEKMLHLDLKPGNVVLREDGTAVLIDFGLSKEYDDVGNPETSTTIGQGTKGYAPIEQAYYNKENKTFSVTIDVYALGATMYKMLTGKTPPDASDILNKGFPKAELKRNGISDYIVDLVEKSMSPIVSDRLQSVDEFLDLLVKAEESEATLKECSGDRDLKEKTLSDEEERKRREEEDIKRRVEEELKRREEEKRHEQELERERRKEEEIKRRVEEELKRRAEEERKRKAEEERKRKEEEERKRKEEEERKRKEDEERKRKAEEQYQLGLSHHNNKDYVKAVECFRKSAEQGNAAAQNWLGFCYKKGQGVTQDYSEAVKWNRKSAEQGNSCAQTDLGSCYYNGEGVSQDYAEAVKWYRKSAEQGNAYGQNNLGSCYYNGEGVSQDYAEAVKWFRKSAEQGNAYGQYNLGTCYYNGEGVTQDYSEAVKWYRKSAEQGNAYGQYDLALCYEKGQGVTQDIAEAMKWYKKAADNGDQDAKDKVEEMTKLIAAKVHQDSMRSWSQARAAKASQLKDQTFDVKGVKFKMIAVEGGTFQMGATSEQGSDAGSDEKPVHSVTLSDYYIGETEVTQELWEAVMGNNPSEFKERFLFKLKSVQKPVESVSWNDCKEFITKLNRLTGKNFRLPTEAEWEYAARGGNISKGYKYSGSNTIGNVAWYYDNSGSATHNVKTKSPNELGIYDMSGNVYEWCEDWFGDYSSGSQTNPTGPSSGSNRVGRGGSWYSYARCCRVSYRYSLNPDRRYYNLGLRLCLSQY